MSQFSSLFSERLVSEITSSLYITHLLYIAIASRRESSIADDIYKRVKSLITGHFAV